jgi:ribosomal protein L32E
MRTLLVVSTGDLEQVTLELIAERIADNLIKDRFQLASRSPESCVRVY